MRTIGVFGLGIMGSRMAANLARAGFDLVVATRTAGKAEAFAAEHGATAAAGAGELFARCDVVVSMVVDGPQALGVAREAAAAQDRPGLLVDMSTIGPGAAREVAAEAACHGWRFCDAPVTGSAPKAEDGTLTIMVGGEAADLEEARPAFEAMGALVVHAGPVGHGQLVKVLNNAVAAANLSTLAQAFLVADAAGADLDALEAVMGAGSGGSTMLALKAAALRGHDYTTLFKAAHMLKDVRLALAEADAAGVPFPAAGQAGDTLAGALARGHADADFAALLEALEGLAGRRLSAG